MKKKKQRKDVYSKVRCIRTREKKNVRLTFSACAGSRRWSNESLHLGPDCVLTRLIEEFAETHNGILIRNGVFVRMVCDVKVI